MRVIEEAIATLGIPGSVAVVILVMFAVLQIIGEFIEASGKVAPTFLKLRKLFTRRREERKAQTALLLEVKDALDAINQHCCPESIAQRNEWMTWVNERANLYDATVQDYTDTRDRILEALEQTTKMTEQLFIEASRDRIIDFASKVYKSTDEVSREEFHRIFKVYQKYEAFLEAHNMTNGEIDLNYELIQEAYRDRIEHHAFVEDHREQSNN